MVIFPERWNIVDILQALDYFGINRISDIDQKVCGDPARIPEVREEVIKKCSVEFRRRAKLFHPDIAHDDGRRMRELNEAYALVKKLEISIGTPVQRQPCGIPIWEMMQAMNNVQFRYSNSSVTGSATSVHFTWTFQ